jgi:hypothetical protein
VLKDYLIKGYVVNERIRKEQLGELRQLVQVVNRAISSQEVAKTVETQDLLNVVVDYTYALDTLDNYDYERLTIDKTTKQERFHATYDNAMEEIARLREKFGGSALFRIMNYANSVHLYSQSCQMTSCASGNLYINNIR